MRRHRVSEQDLARVDREMTAMGSEPIGSLADTHGYTEAMQKKLLRLTAKQVELVKRHSERTGQNESRVIREAIDRALGSVDCDCTAEQFFVRRMTHDLRETFGWQCACCGRWDEVREVTAEMRESAGYFHEQKA